MTAAYIRVRSTGIGNKDLVIVWVRPAVFMRVKSAVITVKDCCLDEWLWIFWVCESGVANDHGQARTVWHWDCSNIFYIFIMFSKACTFVRYMYANQSFCSLNYEANDSLQFDLCFSLVQRRNRACWSLRTRRTTSTFLRRLRLDYGTGGPASTLSATGSPGARPAATADTLTTFSAGSGADTLTIAFSRQHWSIAWF